MSAKSSIKGKTMQEVQDLLQRIANNGFSRGASEDSGLQMLFGMEEEDQPDLKAQVKVLMKWLDAMEV